MPFVAHVLKRSFASTPLKGGRRNQASGEDTGQIVFSDLLPELNLFIQETRQQWEAKVLPIEGFPALVSDAAVMGGSPVIVGTRVETAFVAHLGCEMSLDELAATFSHVSREALIEAIQFEGLEIAA